MDSNKDETKENREIEREKPEEDMETRNWEEVLREWIEEEA